jgi:hypothetical protein
VQHDRRPGVLEDPPHPVQVGVVEVELPHLQVQLEHLDARVDQVGDVGRGVVLRIEGGRPDDLGGGGGEVPRPRVEVRRHAGLVRVGQRREAPHPHRPEQRDAFLVLEPVADRPLTPDLGTGRVELLVDRALDVGRQEVHVRVDEPGQAELLPEGADGGDVLLEEDRTLAHPVSHSSP